MRFHPKLLQLSIANFLGAFAFFYFFNRKVKNAYGFNETIGWIFWLGIFVIIFPMLVKNEVKKEWFSKTYLIGTITLFFLNVFIPMLANYVSVNLIE